MAAHRASANRAMAQLTEELYRVLKKLNWRSVRLLETMSQLVRSTEWKARFWDYLKHYVKAAWPHMNEGRHKERGIADGCSAAGFWRVNRNNKFDKWYHKGGRKSWVSWFLNMLYDWVAEHRCTHGGVDGTAAFEAFKSLCEDGAGPASRSSSSALTSAETSAGSGGGGGNSISGALGGGSSSASISRTPRGGALGGGSSSSAPSNGGGGGGGGSSTPISRTPGSGASGCGGGGNSNSSSSTSRGCTLGGSGSSGGDGNSSSASRGRTLGGSGASGGGGGGSATSGGALGSESGALGGGGSSCASGDGSLFPRKWKRGIRFLEWVGEGKAPENPPYAGFVTACRRPGSQRIPFPPEAAEAGFVVDSAGGVVVVRVFDPAENGPDAFLSPDPKSQYTRFLADLAAARSARCQGPPAAADPDDDDFIDLTTPPPSPSARRPAVGEVLKAAARALERAVTTWRYGSMIEACGFRWRSEGEQKASFLVSLLLLFVAIGAWTNRATARWLCIHGARMRLKNRSDEDAIKANRLWIVNLADFLIHAARLFTLDDDDAPVVAPVFAPVFAPTNPTKRRREEPAAAGDAAAAGAGDEHGGVRKRLGGLGEGVLGC